MGTRVSVVKGTGLVLLALAGSTLAAQSNGVANRLIAEGAAPALGAPAAAMMAGSMDAVRPAQAPALQPKKLAHMHSLAVQRGILTVNGLTAKVGLNFQINDLHYLYIYVPGVGTTVISDQPFAGAIEQKDAFNGDALTVDSGGERLQLTAERRLLGRHSAFVKFDPSFGPSSRMPVMGFGDTAAAPYEWPGALKEINASNPHPVPASLRPALQRETTCTSGTQVTVGTCFTAVMTVAYSH